LFPNQGIVEDDGVHASLGRAATTSCSGAVHFYECDALFSPDLQRRVFAPFFTILAEVGTGIGLWVTKCLIEQRGGYVRFRSRQGERSGTIMSFFLPGTGPASLDVQAAAA
jgi:nitrogen fixation/metabolism regulation signal transduction histidine kinase